MFASVGNAKKEYTALSPSIPADRHVLTPSTLYRTVAHGRHWPYWQRIADATSFGIHGAIPEYAAHAPSTSRSASDLRGSLHPRLCHVNRFRLAFGGYLHADRFAGPFREQIPQRIQHAGHGGHVRVAAFHNPLRCLCEFSLYHYIIHGIPLQNDAEPIAQRDRPNVRPCSIASAGRRVS